MEQIACAATADLSRHLRAMGAADSAESAVDKVLARWSVNPDKVMHVFMRYVGEYDIDEFYDALQAGEESVVDLFRDTLFELACEQAEKDMDDDSWYVAHMDDDCDD